MKILTQENFVQIVERISKEMPADYNMGKALLYGVKMDENDQIIFDKIHEDGDVYEMLNPFNTIWKMKGYNFFSIVTCGWAAPIANDDDDDEFIDLPPSQHPNRRRVMLTVNATIDKKVGSVISFEDDIENAVFDYGNAKGSLADAFMELIECYNETKQ
jgi:hypothetical protein